MPESSVRPDYLTVKELAELLRVTERKVYDLASSGQVPCSKATGKLLFPSAEVDAWLQSARSGPPTRKPTGLERPPVVLGSHDPLLDWAIRHSQSGLATMFDASLDGLRRFQCGEGVAAGLHIRDKAGGWNSATVAEAVESDNAVLVSWVKRTRGFVVRDEHKHALGDSEQLAGLRFASRQPEAGSEVLLHQVITAEGLDVSRMRFSDPYRSEQEAILAVLQGQADVAFGLEMLAEPFGLHFGPVMQESYDLLLDRKAWFDPPLQRLFEFTRHAAFRAQVGRMPGISANGLGSVIWNA